MPQGTTAVFDPEFFRFLSSLGVGGVIAGILFFFYRKDVKQYTELWQTQAALNMEQTKAVMSLLERTTAAVVTNTEVTKSMHRRLDQLVARNGADDDRPSRST